MLKLCPVCQQELVTINYLSFQVDTCSKCGGMWLEAQVLEEIITAVIAMTRRM
ncbi:hypothetical protein ANRL1_04597 [Anaerolineae bacterium]|nr:hypothetical protein ANRL1_04597 [Anaerolineae bacterium]